MVKYQCRLFALLRRFARNEEGSMLVLGLALMGIMILMLGLAVDAMRAEARRANLVHTVDACNLNAAALTQTLDSATVVRDCAARRGMDSYITQITATGSGRSKRVETSGHIPLSTLFIDKLNIPKLDLRARSVAEQRVSNIEIVLALDVSQSMAGTKLASLKTAANSFVDTVLAGNPPGISITVVPYNGQVNLGPALFGKFNVTHIPGLPATADVLMPGTANSNCVDLPPEAFTYTGLSRTMPMPATGWFEGYAEYQANPTPLIGLGDVLFWSTSWRKAAALLVPVMCPSSTVNILRLPSNNATTIKANINALTANAGTTSLAVGMKWAGTMLDPSMRSIFDEFIAVNAIPAAFSGRPFDYAGNDSLKVVVLMTDGENFGDQRLNDAFRVGPSPIWRHSDDRYSIQHTTGRPPAAGANQFWVPHLSRWQATPWGGTLAQRLTWQQVWQRANVSWVAAQLYGRALGTNDTERLALYRTYMNLIRTRRGTDTVTPEMDAELASICNVTKQAGVLIYGVAFSAPPRGIETVRDCASAPSYFFNSTNATQLNAAFRAIAESVTMLRLVQ